MYPVYCGNFTSSERTYHVGGFLTCESSVFSHTIVAERGTPMDCQHPHFQPKKICLVFVPFLSCQLHSEGRRNETVSPMSSRGGAVPPPLFHGYRGVANVERRTGLETCLIRAESYPRDFAVIVAKNEMYQCIQHRVNTPVTTWKGDMEIPMQYLSLEKSGVPLSHDQPTTSLASVYSIPPYSVLPHQRLQYYIRPLASLRRRVILMSGNGPAGAGLAVLPPYLHTKSRGQHALQALHGHANYWVVGKSVGTIDYLENGRECSPGPGLREELDAMQTVGVKKTFLARTSSGIDILRCIRIMHTIAWGVGRVRSPGEVTAMCEACVPSLDCIHTYAVADDWGTV
ncbi:hypothetical protein EDD16DRAFT_1521643 [Pisolithus croceorrhizus]|nr:hypothetical protein EDD16DRAFT_1521643 [Pisolithus croceorrhizus]KAI6125487.1 hypothetical protein EV401DRAFT_2152385 [Pisolithus croceorrhizus]